MYEDQNQPSPSTKTAIIGVLLLMVVAGGVGAWYSMSNDAANTTLQEPAYETIVGAEGIENRHVYIFRMIQPDGGGILTRYTLDLSLGDSWGVSTMYAVEGYKVKSGSGQLEKDIMPEISSAFVAMDPKVGEKQQRGRGWYEFIYAMNGEIMSQVGCNFEANAQWHVAPTQGETECQKNVVKALRILRSAHDMFAPLSDPEAAAEKIDDLSAQDKQSLEKVDLSDLPDYFVSGISY